MRWCPAQGMLISMSRKTVNIGVILVVVVAAVVAVVILLNTEEKDKNVPPVQDTYAIKDACKVLPLATVKQVVGSDLKQSKLEDNPTLKSSTSVTTSCTYYNDKTIVSFTAISARNKSASSDNQNAFVAQNSGAQKIDGYGQAAYWVPSSETLNVFNGNTGYALQGVTLDQAKSIMAKIKEQL